MSLVQVNYLIKGRPFCSVQFPLHRPLVPTTASCHAFEQYVQKNAFGLVCNAAPCRAASFVIPPTFVPVQSWVFSNHDNRRSTRWKSDLVQGACINHDSSSSSSVLNANTGNGRSRELVITPTGEKPLYLRDCRHFVNLTNGIEALPMLHELNLPYSFVRIQSTACEQQNLEALVAELDANLLLSLALGHCCLVYDCGSRGRDGTPRALWYGLEFVRYTLSKLWLRRPCPALLRGKNVSRHFDAQIRTFRQSTIRRLKYYAKYIPPNTQDEGEEEGEEAIADPLTLSLTPSNAGDGDATGDGAAASGLQRLRLYGVYRPTDHDDDASYYIQMLYKYQTGRAFHSPGHSQWPQALAVFQQDQLAAVEDRGSRRYKTQGNKEADDRVSHLDGLAGTASACTASRRMNSYHDVDVTDTVDAQLAAGTAVEGGPGSVANGCVFSISDQAAESGGECSQRGGLSRRQFDTEVVGNMGEGMQGATAGAGDDRDGEAVLLWYGFRLFWRGMSPAEWSAKATAVAMD
ncbi:hypothetical protein Vafri_21771 [Volvox africanus]|uniref:Uncharacterized protein n=1 Tax=Volvox africanus TaxID=51714 RepID=A0A8J4BWA2_9CHLO|nr:hypothetical protein Vafri_21771 [Volvox africanus]